MEIKAISSKMLIEKIKNLKKTRVKKEVDARIKEFERVKEQGIKRIFSELCFCILTANYSALGGIRIQKEIGDTFLTLSEKKLSEELKRLGHRFPNKRAEFIIEARKKLPLIENALELPEFELRNWLVKNIKGIGYKEASHFLRNIGYKNSAIIDFHIIDLLVREGIIERPKTLTKKKYLEVEAELKKIADKVNLNLAELDLYLWYIETGKILK